MDFCAAGSRRRRCNRQARCNGWRPSALAGRGEEEDDAPIAMPSQTESVLPDRSTESLDGPPHDAAAGGPEPRAPAGPEPVDAEAETLDASSLQGPDRRDIPPALRDRYRDIRLLGEGGMGTVLRAYDPRLGRAVALKLLKRSGPEDGQRLLQEARAQARIEHEHVCRVYDTGVASGEPYIAMQLIEGEPLGHASRHMTLEQKVMVMRKVASAVHEAHRVGLIHRDLKPGNILVERADDGSLKPYVVDFGLAREVADRGQTATGAVLGTPAYMAPEQARGDVRALDRRTDVYSLGATLYEILAGRTPFVEEHVYQLLVAVGSRDAPSLRSVKRNIPAELETIVMKALERDPGRRYESARARQRQQRGLRPGEHVRQRVDRVGVLHVRRGLGGQHGPQGQRR
ncbi:MAG: serine/threonine-protein kinase [Minicystis sp.]